MPSWRIAEEGQRLDVADRAADLDEHVPALGAGSAGLDLVGDVRDDLHGRLPR